MSVSRYGCTKVCETLVRTHLSALGFDYRLCSEVPPQVLLTRKSRVARFVNASSLLKQCLATCTPRTLLHYSITLFDYDPAELRTRNFPKLGECPSSVLKIASLQTSACTEVSNTWIRNVHENVYSVKVSASARARHILSRRTCVQLWRHIISFFWRVIIFLCRYLEKGVEWLIYFLGKNILYWAQSNALKTELQTFNTLYF